MATEATFRHRTQPPAGVWAFVEQVSGSATGKASSAEAWSAAIADAGDFSDTFDQTTPFESANCDVHWQKAYYRGSTSDPWTETPNTSQAGYEESQLKHVAYSGTGYCKFLYDIVREEKVGFSGSWSEVSRTAETQEFSAVPDWGTYDKTDESTWPESVVIEIEPDEPPAIPTPTGDPSEGYGYWNGAITYARVYIDNVRWSFLPTYSPGVNDPYGFP